MEFEKIIKTIVKNVSLPKEPKYNLFENIVWYYDNCFAKSNDEYVIIEADIRSAFPTFVNMYFKDKYPNLIENINSINEKIKKNILISTTLTHDELKFLNVLSKAYLLSYIFSNYLVIDMIELKKDGGVFLITDKVINEKCDIFKDVEFKVKPLVKYVRFNNTSFYYYDSSSPVIKGRLKHTPNVIYDFYSNKIAFDKIKDYYSSLYYKILRKLKKYDEMENLFVCKSSKVFLKGNKFVKYEKPSDLINLDPYQYLNTFIIPFYNLTLKL